MPKSAQYTLVIDASTSQAVIALFHNNQCLQEACWPSTRGNPGTLVANIQRLFDDADLPWHALNSVLVGCGPGQYAGLRISVTVAQTLQLPVQGKVYGISSAYALLTGAQGAHPQAPAIVACGDARRKHLWLYVWESGHPLPQMQCLPCDTIAEMVVPTGTLFLSPDFDRLSPRLQLPSTSQWITGNQLPTAAAMIEIANAYPSARTAPTIQYVHPPVATMPPQDFQR